MTESSRRSIAKTITWRLSGSAATFTIAWLISGDLSVAGPIAVIQLICNTLLYYVHERVWNEIDWGRK